MKNELTQFDLKKQLKYDAETGNFTRIISKNYRSKVGDLAGTKTPDGYIQISINSNYYMAHRLAWLYQNGRLPAICIDHIDGNRANNSIKNLREATYSENNENVKKPRSHNKFNLLGVCFDKQTGNYKSQIRVKNKNIHLGRFKTPELAHLAYMEAKRRLHVFCTI